MLSQKLKRTERNMGGEWEGRREYHYVFRIAYANRIECIKNEKLKHQNFKK